MLEPLAGRIFQPRQLVEDNTAKASRVDGGDVVVVGYNNVGIAFERFLTLRRRADRDGDVKLRSPFCAPRPATRRCIRASALTQAIGHNDHE